jgi:predicted cobalt transporter CbtA
MKVFFCLILLLTSFMMGMGMSCRAPRLPDAAPVDAAPAAKPAAAKPAAAKPAPAAAKPATAKPATDAKPAGGFDWQKMLISHVFVAWVIGVGLAIVMPRDDD